MKKLVTILTAALMLFTLNSWAVKEHTQIVYQSDWPAYENGTNVLAIPQVSAILKEFEEHEDVSIQIRYPGGDAGRLWAESMLGWMVSFGVPLSYLELFPGSGGPNQLAIALIDRR